MAQPRTERWKTRRSSGLLCPLRIRAHSWESRSTVALSPSALCPLRLPSLLPTPLPTPSPCQPPKDLDHLGIRKTLVLIGFSFMLLLQDNTQEFGRIKLFHLLETNALGTQQ